MTQETKAVLAGSLGVDMSDNKREGNSSSVPQSVLCNMHSSVARKVARCNQKKTHCFSHRHN